MTRRHQSLVAAVLSLLAPIVVVGGALLVLALTEPGSVDGDGSENAGRLMNGRRLGRSVIERMESLGVRVDGFIFEEEGASRAIIVTCDLPRSLPQTTLVRELSSLPDVKGARWGTG